MWFHLHEIFRISKSTETESKLVVTKIWERVGGKWDMTSNRNKASFWDNENVLTFDCGDSCTTLNILKTIELYLLNEGNFCYVNYISRKLFFKDEETKECTLALAFPPILFSSLKPIPRTTLHNELAAHKPWFRLCFLGRRQDGDRCWWVSEYFSPRSEERRVGKGV